MPERCRSRRIRSFRQLFPGLLSHHVLGVPVRPVRVALPNALLVLAVSGLRTPKRARQVACGAQGSRTRFDATGVPYHDLLQVPAVAVGITEQGARAVGETLGMQAATPAFRAV